MAKDYWKGFAMGQTSTFEGPAPPGRCVIPLVAKRVWYDSGSSYVRPALRLRLVPGVAL